LGGTKLKKYRIPHTPILWLSSYPSCFCFKGHYCTKTAAALLGVGTENCLVVATDPADGRMIPAELETQILTAKARGLRPFFVTATAGSTVYGAWDPLREVADICRRHGVWLHVDVSLTAPQSRATSLSMLRCGFRRRGEEVFC
jgi:glutamate/tyrosine decarboxylase-like PLP-dependent enzyme